jgi:hypothetical protein
VRAGGHFAGIGGSEAGHVKTIGYVANPVNPWQMTVTSARCWDVFHPSAVGTFAGREVLPLRLAHVNCVQAASLPPTLRELFGSRNRFPPLVAKLAPGRWECGRVLSQPPDSVLPHLIPAAYSAGLALQVVPA